MGEHKIEEQKPGLNSTINNEQTTLNSWDLGPQFCIKEKDMH
jgi:hypothetical protein